MKIIVSACLRAGQSAALFATPNMQKWNFWIRHPCFLHAHEFKQSLSRCRRIVRPHLRTIDGIDLFQAACLEHKVCLINTDSLLQKCIYIYIYIYIYICFYKWMHGIKLSAAWTINDTQVLISLTANFFKRDRCFKISKRVKIFASLSIISIIWGEMYTYIFT